MSLTEWATPLAESASLIENKPQIQSSQQNKRDTATATCDKAGQPNDVCPYGQVMLPSAMMFTP